MAFVRADAYTDQVGRELFAVAAWLCDVTGFMCFDSGRQGLGQRYFISGLRMLGRASLVQRHAVGALGAADDIMQRLDILVTATLANSYLPAQDTPRADGDVEQACEVLRGVLPVLGSLTSARALGQVSAFRKRLSGYAQLAAVQELERELDQCLAGTAA